MKKFLVGIVTLVAAVMLTSPAFGALYDWDGLNKTAAEGGGWFYFDGTLADTAPIDNPYDLENPGSGGPAIAELNALGWNVTTIGEQYFGSGAFSSDGDINYVEFDPGVQIVLVQWGGQAGEGGWTQWAFLFDGYTNVFGWEGLSGDVSHAVGFNPVPVPAAVWLLGSGVLGLVAVRRRRS